MDDRGEIVILEDNLDRQAAMLARLQDRFPQYPVWFFHEPQKFIDHVQASLSRTLAISLDHDLDLIPRTDGTLFDPGSGMTVVDWFVAQPPVCPVVIHSTNVPAAKTMKRRLQASGWSARRITPYDDLAWIDADWFDCLRDILVESVNQPSAPVAGHVY